MKKLSCNRKEVGNRLLIFDSVILTASNVTSTPACSRSLAETLRLVRWQLDSYALRCSRLLNRWREECGRIKKQGRWPLAYARLSLSHLLAVNFCTKKLSFQECCLFLPAALASGLVLVPTARRRCNLMFFLCRQVTHLELELHFLHFLDSSSVYLAVEHKHCRIFWLSNRASKKPCFLKKISTF